MKYLAKAFAVIMAITFSLASCSDDDGQDVSDYAKQTIIVYMPWSGSQSTSGLYSYLLANIDSMEAGIKAKKGLCQIPNNQITLSNNVLKQNEGW